MHGLEERVRAQGLSVQSFSQRTTSLAADIAAQAQRMGARLVAGGRPARRPGVGRHRRRAGGRWARPTSASSWPRCPGPRLLAKPAAGPPVVEVGDGPAGHRRPRVRRAPGPPGRRGAHHRRPRVRRAAAPSASARSSSGSGRSGHDRHARRRGLDTPEGAAAATGAVAVVRPFAGPEGLEPVERARPDAERFGCPGPPRRPRPQPARALRPRHPPRPRPPPPPRPVDLTPFSARKCTATVHFRAGYGDEGSARAVGVEHGGHRTAPPTAGDPSPIWLPAAMASSPASSWPRPGHPGDR